MKFKDAMNRPDRDKWKEEIKNEHKRIVTNGILKPLDHNNDMGM